MEEGFTCPKCGSKNVSIQALNEVKIKNAHHSIWWWIFVGWWWLAIKWLIFTIPALFVKLLHLLGIGKKKKSVNKTVKKAVCQQCGYVFNIK